MPLYAPIKSKSAPPTPAGNHVARLYSIMHLGTLPGEYMGEPKETDTVRIGFELPNETKVFKEGEAPKPYVISQEYTLSMGEKANLGKLIRGMLGTPWNPNEDTEAMEDIYQYIGATCLLNVVHQTSKTRNVYAKIISAAPLPKGFEAPAEVNPPYLFDLEDNWSEEKFNAFPDFLKEKIKSSNEYKVKFNLLTPEEAEIAAGDIPF